MSALPPPNADRPSDSPSSRDRFYVGRLIDHGVSRHEHHSNGPPQYYVKILDRDGRQHTIWGGGGLQSAVRNAKTQPQLNELVGVRENHIEPESAVYRSRQQGVVVAERRQDSPRSKWVVERLDFFNERKAAARALRDASLPRHDAVKVHRDLEGAYMVLDEGQKYAREEIKSEEGQRRFLSLLRETLARTVERAAPLPISEQRINAAAAQKRTAVQHSKDTGLARE
jgi:hypothetical protein